MLRKSVMWMLVIGLSLSTTVWLGCAAAPGGGGGGGGTNTGDGADDGMDDGTGDGTGGEQDGNDDGEGGGGNDGADGGGAGDGGDDDTLPAGDSGPACASDEDCGIDGSCIDGGCLCQCDTDADCPENSACQECICVEVENGGDDGNEGGDDGDPAPDMLTFDNFGRDFFDSHCTICHSVDSDNRFGAPISINFDTYDEVLALIDRIEFRAVTTATMPPASAPSEDLFPTDEERAMLGEWIADGAPEN